MKRRIILLAVAIVLIPAGIYGWNRTHVTRMHTLERKLELASLAEEAELIIVGKPVKSKSRIVKNESTGTLIYTDWTIEVRESLTGKVPNPLVVTVPGGERFGQKTIADQFEGFKKDTEYLMYLSYVPEGKWWAPLSTTQAVFEKKGASYVDLAGRSQTFESAKELMKSVQK